MRLGINGAETAYLSLLGAKEKLLREVAMENKHSPTTELYLYPFFSKLGVKKRSIWWNSHETLRHETSTVCDRAV
jgi:hypothetical protein